MRGNGGQGFGWQAVFHGILLFRAVSRPVDCLGGSVR